jgi:hypothetical protein
MAGLAACRGVLGIETLDYVAGSADGSARETGADSGSAPQEEGGADSGVTADAPIDQATADQGAPDTGTPGEAGPPPSVCANQGGGCRMCCHNQYPMAMPDQTFAQSCLCNQGSPCVTECNPGPPPLTCPVNPSEDAAAAQACGMCMDNTAASPPPGSCAMAVENCRYHPDGGTPAGSCAYIACVAGCP